MLYDAILGIAMCICIQYTDCIARVCLITDDNGPLYEGLLCFCNWYADIEGAPAISGRAGTL